MEYLDLRKTALNNQNHLKVSSPSAFQFSSTASKPAIKMSAGSNSPVTTTPAKFDSLAPVIKRVGIAAAIALAAAAFEWIRRSRRGKIRDTPPVPEEKPHKVLFGYVEGKDHGNGELMNPPKEREDPYFWLRDDDRKNPHVIDHLTQENAYTNYMTLDQKPFVNKLYKEMLTHVKEDDESLPTPKGDHAYYSKTIKGKSYDIMCRKKILQDGSLDSNEQIILDINQLAKNLKHCDVLVTVVSPDGKILAYTIDTSGYETYDICFKNLETDQLITTDKVKGTTGSIFWGKDSSEIYYGTMDDAHRPNKIWRHKMVYNAQDVPKEDECLMTEDETEFVVFAHKSRSERLLFIHSAASTVSESKFIDLHNPQKGVQLIRKRETNVLYNPEHGKDDIIYIATNASDATNFKLMKTTIQNPSEWSEFLPYKKEIKVSQVTCFRDFAVLYGREDGFTQLWILPNHDPSKIFKIETEELSHDMTFGQNLEYDTDEFRYGYSSLTKPRQILSYNILTSKTKLLKQKEVPNYDEKKYKTERIEATSADGTKIPISIVYNELAIKKNEPNFLHLYGYGSYEISVDPYFSMRRLPLLDRGVICAIAHIRGGGEYGRPWYEAARFETKKKTFEDFCACAQQLVDDGRTTSQKMAIEGRSAGGMLMGAVMNMRPDLFKAVIAGVPFVDVMNTMSDPSIPLTTNEWQEWGNPHQEKYYEAMEEYCPYSNVSAKPYPAVLILAGLYDPRVLYSEPTKWAAKLRKYSTSDEPVLLKVDLSSGHFSASDRYFYIKEMAFEKAWMLRQLGAPEDPIA